MWDEIEAAIKLGKEFGLDNKGIVFTVIFATIASLAGRSALAAVKFVRLMLDTSSDLRKQIKTQLDEVVDRLARAQRDLTQEQDSNRRLKSELEEATRELRDEIEKSSITEAKLSTMSITIGLRDQQLRDVRKQIDAMGLGESKTGS